MNGVVLGFDTSNYRTSAAAVTMDGEVLINQRTLLPVPEGERGMRQNEAVFAHLKQINDILEPFRSRLKGYSVVAVAASTKPRDPEESYMPVFRVGATIAGSIADVCDVPFYSTTHQRGHISAALLGTQLENENRFLAFHLSGGTTDLLEVNGQNIKMLGTSCDLHAGQLIDRIGVTMGFPFPSGPYLEKLAENGKSKGLLGSSLDSQKINCHLSGAETKAMQWIHMSRMKQEDIACEVFDFLARTTAKMIRTAAEITGINRVLIFGGVASSGLFRSMLTARCCAFCRKVELEYGNSDLCGDNAVGVARIGLNRYLMDTEG